MEFYERVSGSRLHSAYFRPGGVHRDLPDGLDEDIKSFCERFPKHIDDLEKLIEENRIFKQRSVGIGKISKEDALSWGFTGPCLKSNWIKLGFKKKSTI